jgi:hypothetical protein
MTTSRRGVSVTDLFGGRSMSQKQATYQMAFLEQQLIAEFNESVKQRAALAAQMKKVQRPILDLVSKDPQTKAGVEGLHALQASAQKRKVKFPVVAKATPRIFASSIGATMTPPYDFPWTWNAVSGNPSANTETADKSMGTASIYIWTDNNSNNSSSVSAAAAVGFYFYPALANGSLQIWSTPSFNDLWGTYCNLDGAHADAWIGILVIEFDMEGGNSHAVVSQQISLWSDNSWWGGTGTQTGSNAGYSLYAPPIQVDQDHQYNIWVWCGGSVSGAGWGTFSGSAAGDSLNLTVPSITWELG